MRTLPGGVQHGGTMKIFTREALHDLVWTQPPSAVTVQLGISSVAVRKVCAAAKIPVPDRAYWVRVKAGRNPLRFPLPRRDPGAAHLVEVGVSRWKGPEGELAEPLPAPPTFLEPIEAVAERIKRRVGKIARSTDLKAPDPALRKLLEKDERRRVKYQETRYVWDKPLFDSPFEVRRLRLLNSLAFGLPKGGAHLHVQGDTAREVTATVGQTRVKLSLDHPFARPDQHGRHLTREGPVGELRLEIEIPADSKPRGFQSVWEDAEDKKLEAHLTAIVVAIITAGEVHYRANQASHHVWLMQRRKENEAEVARRRAEAERRAREAALAAEKARRDRLHQQANDWRAAQDIRGFVRDVLSQSPSPLPLAEAQVWAAWALAEADAIDPCLNGSLTPPAS
jgi:hypothetical protein